jgi:hypothetical protein
MGIALRLAGFELRDTIAAYGLQWLYGSGFPKSLDIGKALDKAADYELQATVRRAAVSAVEEAGLRLPSNSRWDWTTGEHAPGPAWWAMFQKWLPGLNDTDRAHVERLTVETVRKTAGWFTSKDIYDTSAPATDDAKRWSGWGTAMKPAVEPILLCRKPLSERNIALNVLRWGTGGINVDACRVETANGDDIFGKNPHTHGGFGHADSQVYGAGKGSDYSPQEGRWPPNAVFIHSPSCRQIGERKVRGSRIDSASDHQFQSGYGGKLGGPRPARGIGDVDGMETVADWACADDCPVAELDRQSGTLAAGGNPASAHIRSTPGTNGTMGGSWAGVQRESRETLDSGGASRFFPTFRYQAKADTAERNIGLPHGERNSHPTTKPVELMQWLCRLITPPGGIVLDPFAGSGTTGMAALREGFRFIGVEQDPEHAETARLRIEGDAPLLNAPVVPALLESPVEGPEQSMEQRVNSPSLFDLEDLRKDAP